MILGGSDQNMNSTEFNFDIQVIQTLGNYEAESSVVGAIFLEPDLIRETKLLEKHFMADRRLKIIFNAMKSIDQEGRVPDLVTVVTKLKNKDVGLVDQVGGVTFLSQLAGSVPTTANFKYYEDLVLQSYRMIQTVLKSKVFTDAILQGSDPDLVDDYLQEISKIQDAGVESKFDMLKVMGKLMDELEEGKGDLTGADTGYTELNKLTEGLQDEDLIIVGARPSVGKTAFCLNVARNTMEKQDTLVDIFSLEMSEESLMKRFLSIEGNIDGSKMRNMKKYFTPEDYRKFTLSMGKISNFNLRIHDTPGQTVEQIRSIARQSNKDARKMGVKHLVIIDYLQLINYVGPLQNPVQQVGHISKSLKQLARDLKCPVVALSQLSRGVEQRQDKRPMMSDIRESGNIEQDADVIALLYRDDYYDKESENQNIIEIIIAKHRNGPLGTVQLAFLKEYGKFVNLARRYQDEQN